MGAERVLLTGASSGIGLELARLFAADHSDLVLVARRRDVMEDLASQLRTKHGVDVRVVAEDLGRADGPERVMAALEREGLTVDVLVNNAAFGLAGLHHQLDLERQLEMIQLNVTSLVSLSRRLLPGMVARKRGGVLNVASTASFQPGPNMAVYYATKAFVLSYTEGLAEELGDTGVRAACLCPGPTRTGFESIAGLTQTALFKFFAMDAPKVAMQGYKGFRSGRVITITGASNSMGVFLVRFAPRVLVRKVVRSLQS